MISEETTLSFQDGAKNSIVSYIAPSAKSVIILLPAMGIRASYYYRFAEQLAQQNISTILMDWRGFGKSSERPSHRTNFGYQQLLEDTILLLQTIKERYKEQKIYLMGHSLGGQIGALSLSTMKEKIDGLILIACGLPYYKHWDGLKQLQLHFANVIFPLAARIFGYFPGHIMGFADKEARGVMRDWCYTLSNGTYRINGKEYDPLLKQLHINTLVLRIEHDWLAPEKAIKGIYEKLHPESVSEKYVLPQELPNGKKLNHFNWTRYSDLVIEKVLQFVTYTRHGVKK